MPNSDIINLAQKIWKYHQLNHSLKSAHCIIGLGSYDLRVAERCVDLYQENLAPVVIFSGGLGTGQKIYGKQVKLAYLRNML